MPKISLNIPEPVRDILDDLAAHRGGTMTSAIIESVTEYHAHRERLATEGFTADQKRQRAADLAEAKRLRDHCIQLEKQWRNKVWLGDDHGHFPRVPAWLLGIKRQALATTTEPINIAPDGQITLMSSGGLWGGRATSDQMTRWLKVQYDRHPEHFTLTDIGA